MQFNHFSIIFHSKHPFFVAKLQLLPLSLMLLPYDAKLFCFLQVEFIVLSSEENTSFSEDVFHSPFTSAWYI